MRRLFLPALIVAIVGTLVVMRPAADSSQEVRARLNQALDSAVAEGWAGSRQIQLTHATSTILVCTGYGVDGHWFPGGGTDIWSETNLCLATPGYPDKEPVTRSICYRNGVPFGGSGAPGGCRWEGRIGLQTSQGGWHDISGDTWAEPGPYNPDFIQDTGRVSGAHIGFVNGIQIRAYNKDRAVRFKAVDGTVSSLFGLGNKYSPAYTT